MVPPSCGAAERTKSTPTFDDKCSSTTLRPGKLRSIGASRRSMKTSSRSNTSMSGATSSPWISSTMPIFSMRSSTGRMRAKSVTPAAELVVALAG